MLDGLKVGDQPLEYIVAVPGRRYAEFVEVLAEVQPLCVGAHAELIGEVPWTPAKAKAKDSPQKRLVWAHDPQRAAEQSSQREVRMAELLSRVEHSVAKLDAQDDGQKSKGRKLSDAGARARLYHEVIEARLGRIIKVDLKNEQLSWDINEDALAQARLMDGKLLLVTNVADLTPTEVVLRYKSLADIERGCSRARSRLRRCSIGCPTASGPMPRSASSPWCFTASCACGSRPPAARPHSSGRWSCCANFSATASICPTTRPSPAGPPSPPNRRNCSPH